MGCTPSATSSPPAAPDAGSIEGAQKLSEQEALLETVGLKFSIQSHQNQGQEVTYVTWDTQVRQEWLETHNTEEDLALQAQELQKFLSLAEAEQALLEETGSEDLILLLKISLAKK